MAYKGVYWHKNKWLVRVSFSGKQITVGRFADEQDAARAYDKKALQLFGSKAELNFPGEVVMPEVREVPVDAVSTAAQIPGRRDNATVEKYREPARQGVLPPIIVFTDDGQCYYVGDGDHRLEAHKLEGKSTIKAEVRHGGLTDAILWSAGANAVHGLPRTDVVKENSVKKVLAQEEYENASSRWIAEVCHVSHSFVEKVRNDPKNKKQPTYSKPAPPPKPTGVESSRNGDKTDSASDEDAEDSTGVESSRNSGDESGAQSTANGRHEPSGNGSPKPAPVPTRTGRDGKTRPAPKKSATSQADANKDDLGKTVPNRLIEIFSANIDFKKAMVSLKKSAKLLKEVEESEAYVVAEEGGGKDKKLYSTMCLTATRKLECRRPAAVCSECGHEEEPSPDAEPCKVCGGKGYLTGEEVESGVEA